MSGWILLGASTSLALALILIIPSRQIASAIVNRRRSFGAPEWSARRVRAVVLAVGVLALLIFAANVLAFLFR